MSSDADNTPGTRAIDLDVEVPGTPEEVWEAVASGPGITAWFVPAKVDGRVGGTLELDFGPLYGSETPGSRPGTRCAGSWPRRPTRAAPPSPPSGWWRPATAAPAWSG